MRQRLAVVYAVQRPDGAVKIGYSRQFSVRLQNLSCAHRGLRVLQVVPVRAADGRRIEARAHRMLEEKHLGGEWFAVQPFKACRAIAAAADWEGPSE